MYTLLFLCLVLHENIVDLALIFKTCFHHFTTKYRIFTEARISESFVDVMWIAVSSFKGILKTFALNFWWSQVCGVVCHVVWLVADERF